MSKGSLIVLSGPAGSGKDTILQACLKDRDDTFLSISATTRAMRPGETENVSYYFISKEEFEEKIARGEMLEYASYCDNYYGTPKDKVYEKLNAGKNVILEIEVQGAMKVKACCPEAVMVFIMPPSLKELRNRLVGRGTEDEKTIEKRLARAVEEIKLASEYNYIVVNDVVEKAAADLGIIIRSQQLKSNKEIIDEVLNYDA